MPIPTVVGLVVAVATWRVAPLLWAALFDVLFCSLLYSLVRLFFRGVTLRPTDVQKHLDFYNHDSEELDEAKKVERLREYKTVALNYYNFATQIFHKIWSPHYSMGIIFPTEDRRGWMNYPQAQSVYQCYLALQLGMREHEEAGDVYGDFGCGTGGPTRMIAQFSGAKILAVNINKMHLEMLAKFNEQFGLSKRIVPVLADYHETGLASNSLSGVYMCESAACTYDHKVLCREVFRVLKPGALYTGFDWQMTDKFDESNSEHRRVRRILELGVGVPRLVPMSYMREALLEAGFEVEVLRDHSDWAHSLGGKHWDGLFDEYKNKFFLTSLLRAGCSALEWAGLVSPLVGRAVDVMTACREGMLQGGPAGMGIFSPMIFWRARKPARRREEEGK